MRATAETQQSDWIMPPMLTAGVTGATGQTYPAAGPTVIAIGTTPVTIDLTTLCGTPAKAKVPLGNDDYNPNPVGHYVTLEADGDDIYYLFGDASLLTSTISPTAVSTVGATGVLATPFTGAVGATVGCKKLPNNTSKDFKLPAGSAPPGAPNDNADVGRYSPARYLQVRSSTGPTVYLRIDQSSP